MKILDNRVVVRPTKVEEKTLGGVLIPEVHRKRPLLGTVLYVGPGSLNQEGKTIPMEVRVGDTVMFPDKTGVEILSEDKEALLMFRETDIFAIVTK